ncbi:hypothetical protein A0J61_01562 [Choanephora cucurbitarum]|uniref:BHLH domain-containing protein n=1 Tax=Choanephora cucurbitarum TaxID=101091 RepID=A0A1C7NMM3_9FUNG|nr:hypothetical protein A0J61_01562 [Choanephora cucurbitarum]
MLNNNKNNSNEDCPELSEFDLVLQKQAQLAIEQELEAWRDFENYLSPVQYDDLTNSRNQQDEAIFNYTNTYENSAEFTSLLSDSSIVYKPYDLQSDIAVQSLDLSERSESANTIDLKHSMIESSENNILSASLYSPSSTPYSPDRIYQQLSLDKKNLMSDTSLLVQQLQQPSPVSVNVLTPVVTPVHSPSKEAFTASFSPQTSALASGFSDQNDTDLSTQGTPMLPLDSSLQFNLLDSNVDFSLDNTNLSVKARVPEYKRSAHNAIERRYRNNINDRIAELKNAVPALVHAKIKKATAKTASANDDDEEEDDDCKEEIIDGVAVATKLNKATILKKSTEYIVHLKHSEEELRRENDLLQQLLFQLPGGQDILLNYCMQKAQRHQELENEQLRENALQEELKSQQRKTRGRKRTREVQENSFASNSTKSNKELQNLGAFQKKAVSKQAKKQKTNTSNRVFMALFMAISLFSSSPLSAGPSTKDQFESHKHVSRTADEMFTTYNNSSPTLASNTFHFSDTWSTIRTTLFIICLFQFLSPLIRFWLPQGFRIKKVNKKVKSASAENKASLDGNFAAHTTALTPGDQKCMQMYNILAKSLETDNAQHHKISNSTVFPQKDKRPITLFLALAKEAAQYISRHWLGYEIFYSDQDLSPQEQWVQACKWIKLNEIECLGGNPDVTRASMLYSCLHMLNLIETMEDDENEYVGQSRSRVYATAAMQMALIVPHHGIAEKLSRYFWRLSMYESGLEDDPLMCALVFDCHEDDGEDRMELMLSSRAWSETLEVMYQQIEHFGKSETTGLSLSMTAPVLIPVGILSTLHLLDNLQTQFGRLVISVTAKPLTPAMIAEEDENDFSESTFSFLMDITQPALGSENRKEDYHRLAHWFATVGAIIDYLWKSNITSVERLLPTLVQDVPRSLISREVDGDDVVGYKERMNQIDELTKKSIIHTLIGATFLKKHTAEHQKRGVEELKKAEYLKLHLKKVTASCSSGELLEEPDLESSVLALAEFVSSVVGLETWIYAWRLAPVLANNQVSQDEWEAMITDRVRHSSMSLRRMIRRHSLNGLRTNEELVERLSKLGSFVSGQADETECLDLDQENEEESLANRSEKALEILRGLI